MRECVWRVEGDRTAQPGAALERHQLVHRHSQTKCVRVRHNARDAANDHAVAIGGKLFERRVRPVSAGGQRHQSETKNYRARFHGRSVAALSREPS